MDCCDAESLQALLHRRCTKTCAHQGGGTLISYSFAAGKLWPMEADHLPYRSTVQKAGMVEEWS
jgi:hypothetical protein